MKSKVEDLPIAAEALGEMIRGQELGGMTSAYMEYPTGLDLRPMLAGLERDHCQCPHWGFVLRGRLTTTDANGSQETVSANDLFYWPPGHNVRVEADAEIVMFSPQHEHSEVIDHMIARVQGG